jgi:epoxyqueuosine reductase
MKPDVGKSSICADATEVTGEGIKHQLVTLAHTLGFASCRIAAAAPPLHAKAFQEWLANGAEGEMSYMRRGEAKRCDPQLVLPDARSVVVVAMSYYQGTAAPRARADTGTIARYAWGDDYHDVMAPRLSQIDSFLGQFGGKQKRYVDTGPILERDFAAQAGIGWHGKSTMLVHEKLGTWFFLAEVFTTLELPPDPPSKDRCGTCTRCIAACPTGAITAPHKLDARRCISYLTIEHKTSIPVELRPLIGDRIYGCDDCLEACPWNRFAGASREAAFAARPATFEMMMRDYLLLTEAEFRLMFRSSPIKRIKRRGFLRNVCVALGNVGGQSDLPALERAAADAEPLVAEHARWAIDQIRSRSKVPAARTAI